MIKKNIAYSFVVEPQVSQWHFPSNQSTQKIESKNKLIVKNHDKVGKGGHAWIKVLGYIVYKWVNCNFGLIYKIRISIENITIEVLY